MIITICILLGLPGTKAQSGIEIYTQIGSYVIYNTNHSFSYNHDLKNSSQFVYPLDKFPDISINEEIKVEFTRYGTFEGQDVMIFEISATNPLLINFLAKYIFKAGTISDNILSVIVFIDTGLDTSGNDGKFFLIGSFNPLTGGIPEYFAYTSNNTLKYDIQYFKTDFLNPHKTILLELENQNIELKIDALKIDNFDITYVQNNVTYLDKYQNIERHYLENSKLMVYTSITALLGKKDSSSTANYSLEMKAKSISNGINIVSSDFVTHTEVANFGYFYGFSLFTLIMIRKISYNL